MSDDDGIQAWAPIEVVEGLLKRAEQAEAAIQRVRDVCDLFQRRYDSSIRHPTDIPAVAIVAVRRALDGESDG